MEVFRKLSLALISILVFLLFIFTTPAFSSPAIEMRNPKEIELTGLERHVSLASPIGRIELRWTRESERLFGKTPERATIEAANSVAKALKQSSFPSRIKSINIDWQIVFLSKDLKQGQVPDFLLSNCHPGWMTPPANIYIASEQAAGGCAGQAPLPGSIADSQLERVLIHELGHSIEYALAPNAPRDRARSEGFATWFEVFASRYSSILNSASILSEQRRLARQKASSSDQSFQGGGADYALASILFHLVTDNRTVADLSRIYELMSSTQISFLLGVKKISGWTDKMIEQKASAFLGLKS